jgi:hypothetical protein
MIIHHLIILIKDNFFRKFIDVKLPLRPIRCAIERTNFEISIKYLTLCAKYHHIFLSYDDNRSSSSTSKPQNDTKLHWNISQKARKIANLSRTHKKHIFHYRTNFENVTNTPCFIKPMSYIPLHSLQSYMLFSQRSHILNTLLSTEARTINKYVHFSEKKFCSPNASSTYNYFSKRHRNTELKSNKKAY